MNVLNLISTHAETASQRYRVLVDNWRSVYKRVLLESDFGSTKQLKRVIDGAYASARSYLDEEYKEISKAFMEISLEARRAAISDLASSTAIDLTDRLSDHLIEAEDYLKREIAIQVERDIAFLRQSIRNTYLQVGLASKSQNISVKSALMRHQIGNVTELHFFFHDRRNQKWPSQKFIRSVWRHSLLNLYNEMVLMTFAEHGVDVVQVDHMNKSAASHGMKVSMSPNSVYPTYFEIRNDVFHPNSDAILKGVVNVYS